MGIHFAHDLELSDLIEAVLLVYGHGILKGKRWEGAEAYSLVWWLENGLLVPLIPRQNGGPWWLFTFCVSVSVP